MISTKAGLFICLFLVRTSSIPVDNGVIGDLQIECDSRTISLQIATENPFFGTIFVKDFSADPACYTKGTGHLTAFLQFEIGFCGTLRVRTLNPRGTVVDSTIVISFHPFFITKVDRSYHVQCIYKESENNVSDALSVGDITTQTFSRNVSMPVCSYQILDGGPSGEPVAFGVIGQQVYHQWKCESENADTFCMLVHTCSTEDGKGENAFLIDSNGCAIDRYLLSNLEYPTDLTAGQEAHVYKFADRDALFFQCQISITVKEPGEECYRPTCDNGDPPLFSVEGGGTQSNLAPYGSKAKANAAISLSQFVTESAMPSSLEVSDSVSSDDLLIEASRTAQDIENLQNIQRFRRHPPFKTQPGETLDVRTKLQVIDVNIFPLSPSTSANNHPKPLCISSNELILLLSYLFIYLTSIFFTITIVLICDFYYS